MLEDTALEYRSHPIHIATFPGLRSHDNQSVDMNDYPNAEPGFDEKAWGVMPGELQYKRR